MTDQSDAGGRAQQRSSIRFTGHGVNMLSGSYWPKGPDPCRMVGCSAAGAAALSRLLTVLAHWARVYYLLAAYYNFVLRVLLCQYDSNGNTWAIRITLTSHKS
eukprot:6619852-Pyramimonas_sp.AAC.1